MCFANRTQQAILLADHFGRGEACCRKRFGHFDRSDRTIQGFLQCLQKWNTDIGPDIDLVDSGFDRLSNILIRGIGSTMEHEWYLTSSAELRQSFKVKMRFASIKPM